MWFLLLGIIVCWFVISDLKERHDKNIEKFSDWLKDEGRIYDSK